MASPTGSSLGLKLKDKTKKLKGKIFGPSREPSTSSLPAADSVSASDTSGAASTESWWSKNREEIFASVRQVLDVTEKALDGVPVPGAKAIVAGVSEVLKIYQTKWGNEKAMMDLKNEVERVIAIIQPYETPRHDGLKVPAAMQERMRKLRHLVSELSANWEETATKHTIQKHLSGELISEDIKDLTRKLASSVQVAMFEGSLRVEATVSSVYDKQLSGEKKQQLDVLKTLTPVTSAFYDAAGAPAGCLKGTRVDLLKRTYDWLSDGSESSPSVLWLSGLAGTGKSTIARTIASKVNRDRQLAGSFFFSRDNEERRSLPRIVPTIVYQIALWNEGLRSAVCSAIHASPDIAEKGMSQQVDLLIVRAMRGVALSSTTRGLLVLDALDECDKAGGVEGGSLLPLLMGALAKLPFRLKILVTSRPEYSITTMFDDPKLKGPTDVLVLHAIDPNVVMSDIALYLTHQLSDISRRRMKGQPWPAKNHIDALVKLAGPLFVFASTAIKFIDSAAFPPQRQLDIILRNTEASAQSRPFQNLDQLYLQVMCSAVDGETEVDAICARLRKVVSAIIYARKPLSASQLSALLSLDPVEVDYALRPLGNVLKLSPSDRDVIEVFHPSFAEFLTNAARCNDDRFRVTAYMGQRNLSQGCLAVLKSCFTRTRLDRITAESVDYAQAFVQSHIKSLIRSASRTDGCLRDPDISCIARLKAFMTSGKMHETQTLEKDDGLCKVARQSHIVVIMMENDCCAALIVPRGSPTIQLLRMQLVTFQFVWDARQLMRGLLPATGPRYSKEDYTVLTLERVWEHVVNPVVTALKLSPSTGRNRPRIHWRLIGLIANLPLHAAGRYKSEGAGAPDSHPSISDYAVSSYVPTLSVLLAHQAHPRTYQADQFKSCLIHSKTHQAAQRTPDNLLALAKCLARAPGQAAIVTGQASEALEALKGSHLLHATIGRSKEESANDILSYRYSVAEGSLGFRDVFDLRLDNAVLAFIKQEATQFFTMQRMSMLTCGFNAVIANVWRVTHEEDRDFVVEELYDQLLSNAGGTFGVHDIAYALDHAVAKLRKKGLHPTRWALFMHMGA